VPPEGDPIFDHARAVLVIETTLLISVVITWAMKQLTSYHNHIEWLELVEIWAVLAVVSLFACCTLLKVFIRSVGSVVDEIRRRNWRCK